MSRVEKKVFLIVIAGLVVAGLAAYLFFANPFSKSSKATGEQEPSARVEEKGPVPGYVAPVPETETETPVAPAPWQESDYLKSLPANKADAIFPRLVMTKRSLVGQAGTPEGNDGNPQVQQLIALYQERRNREFDVSELRLERVPSGVYGTAWYRDVKHRGAVVALVKAPKWLPSGSAVWVNGVGEIVLVGGCGNFFEQTQPPKATSKPHHERVFRHPCKPIRRGKLTSCTLVAPVPRGEQVCEEWVTPSRERNVQTAHNTPQGKMDYRAGSTIIGYGRSTKREKPKTCPTDEKPPIQPPTDWIKPCR